MRKKRVKLTGNLFRALCLVLLLLFIAPIFTENLFKKGSKSNFAAAESTTVDLTTVMQDKVFAQSSVADFDLPYRIYVPENYTASKTYGVILFLHGENDRGNNNISQVISSEAQFMGKVVSDSATKDNFIVLAPQCPAAKTWVDNDTSSLVMALVNDTINNYSVDTKKILLTGFSMGGTAVWNLLANHSDVFAAAMPVGGEGNISMVLAAANMPIWAFHYKANGNYAATYELVTALQQLGAGTFFTDMTENNWAQAYKNENAFRWFVAQEKKAEFVSPEQSFIKIKGTPIANVERPNIGLMIDGTIPVGTAGDEQKSTDTWSAGGSDPEHYFGLTFASEQTLSKVVYTEGYHWNDGGWFANGFRVEVLCDGTWQTVNFSVSPNYPLTNDQYGLASFVSFEITLDDVLCEGVRVIGVPGGTSKFISCSEFEAYECEKANTSDQNTSYNVLTDEEIKDKIKGGWAGQMIGVAWGFPTEFKANGTMLKDNEIPAYSSISINDAFWQDDLYVEIPFMDALKQEGLDVSIETLAEYFKNTSFQLWHGNEAARKNLLNGVPAELAGHYLYNSCCEDIDWQIEADFIGQITVGDVEEAINLAYNYGHIIGYADGVYGGVYVSAMHAKAFTATNITEIIVTGLQSVPKGSKFRSLLDDVLTWYADGKSFDECWRLLWAKWGGDDRCVEGQGASRNYNIDAKINAGYCLMGLLYGNGDMEESMRLSMKCGCDSDCNPSTVGGILGNYYGFEKIDKKFLVGLDVNKQFSYTTYSLANILDMNYELALEKTISRGGSIQDGLWTLPTRKEISSAPLEVWEEQPSVRISHSLKKKILTVNAEVYSVVGIQTVEWNYGDGSTGTGANARHTYASYGNYTVTCKVLATDGSMIERTFVVSIENNVAIDGTAIVSQESPQGGGNKNKNCINDGKKGELGSGDGGFQYDTFIFSAPEHDDWFGIAFDEVMVFDRIIFTEGIHFADGGWFENGVKVQVRVNGEWIDVELLDNPYPIIPAGSTASDASFTSYTFRFNPIAGDAVRVYGKAGGSGKFASCSELAVFLCEDVEPTLSVDSLEYDATVGGSVSVEFEAYGWNIGGIQINGKAINTGYKVKDNVLTLNAGIFGDDDAVLEINVLFDNGSVKTIVANVKGIEKEPEISDSTSDSSSDMEDPDSTDSSSNIEQDSNVSSSDSASVDTGTDSTQKKGCFATMDCLPFLVVMLLLGAVILNKKKAVK